ncbi:BMP family ABC transporter substrate-binding protein [Gryllotalpicola protaetiae]|uniref:BMP family ABC transporter substrate-binding protein n=1 Tax=Gryllotalpicola protaetiae TaxID=2419771 RepID=A0A387BKR2_9MICO|nr:BMP family ABC transporter substrate-binding protein [Gryllotalpicola protaetiae]AYG03248.1 BMP family ABC transporter substrate-binding protein [Gryllotalpicola protaetiae]
MRTSARAAAAIVAAAAVVLLAACSGSSAASTGASKKATTVGFIMVGSTDDAGYNEAVEDGAKAVEKDLGTSVKVITADNIPENDSVTQTMQAMANQGAKIIFATSYGYYKYALEFAKAHPDITVLHQGGFLDGTFPKNFGTYWGEAYDPVGLGGMAAGAVTKSDKLGFIYAFPIAQSIANIDAFELGAQKVNPNAQTYVVNTSNWCDPLKQKQAVTALLNQGVDVFSQHQDCQSTVIQAVKSAGKKIVGYHYDAKSLDPDGWLTGSAWKWAPVYEAIIKSVEGGTFTGSKYNANWTGTFADGNNPLQLASFGSSVPADVQSKILAEKDALSKPGSSIFEGPIYCQDGTVLVPAGKTATYADTNSFSCLVKGVVGTLPKS